MRTFHSIILEWQFRWWVAKKRSSLRTKSKTKSKEQKQDRLSCFCCFALVSEDLGIFIFDNSYCWLASRF